MAHHISTNIQMKATAPHIAKNLTRKSKVFFITCYFFYFVYKVIAFFINYCNLENSEYCMNLISCWLPPRTISKYNLASQTKTSWKNFFQNPVENQGMLYLDIETESYQGK